MKIYDLQVLGNETGDLRQHAGREHKHDHKDRDNQSKKQTAPVGAGESSSIVVGLGEGENDEEDKTDQRDGKQELQAKILPREMTLNSGGNISFVMVGWVGLTMGAPQFGQARAESGMVAPQLLQNMVFPPVSVFPF